MASCGKIKGERLGFVSHVFSIVEISRNRSDQQQLGLGFWLSLNHWRYFLLAIDRFSGGSINSVRGLAIVLLTRARKRGRQRGRFKIQSTLCYISTLCFTFTYSRIRCVYRWVGGKCFDIWIISSNVNLMDLPEVKLMLLRYVQQTRRNFPRLWLSMFKVCKVVKLFANSE